MLGQQRNKKTFENEIVLVFDRILMRYLKTADKILAQNHRMFCLSQSVIVDHSATVQLSINVF